MWLSLILLRGTDWAGLLNTLFMVLVVWASDTGAYLAGRALGGPKLAPAISPGKTWSGAAGGLLAAILVGAGVASLLAPGGASRAAAIAAMLGLMSTLCRRDRLAAARVLDASVATVLSTLNDPWQ